MAGSVSRKSEFFFFFLKEAALFRRKSLVLST